MDNIIIIAVTALGGLALVSAIILYFIASKFKVYEDPRIDEVEEALPSAIVEVVVFLDAGLLQKLLLKKPKRINQLKVCFAL